MASPKDLFAPQGAHGTAVHLKEEIVKEEADDYFERLKEQVPWTLREWKMGRTLPRMVYQYTPEIDSPIEVLDELMLICGEVYECDVKAAWCNYYRDGNDYTPFHQDSYGTSVFTYSFGDTRRFITQQIGTGEKKEYELDHGDVFYFDEQFDSYHKHSIPKTTKRAGERISIVIFTSKPYSSTYPKDESLMKVSCNGDIGTVIASNMDKSILEVFLSHIGLEII